MLFYARLLEKQLLTYELQGTTHVVGETTETEKQRTGPVVACLDTSGSMQGQPMLKAKALLLAIANILQQENRSLHVLLFGARDGYGRNIVSLKKSTLEVNDGCVFGEKSTQWCCFSIV